MSGFCVFGISKSHCKKQANNKQKTFEFVASPYSATGRRVEPGIAEWVVRRDELAEKLFAETTRAVQISPKFDAPQFCADWIASAPSEVRNCVIMCRMQKIDKNGKPVLRGGVFLTTWAEYAPKAKIDK